MVKSTGTQITNFRNFKRYNMKDINGEEFQVGDHLKVIKGSAAFRAGTVLVCVGDDGSDYCEFLKVGGDPRKGSRYVKNKRLQKV